METNFCKSEWKQHFSHKKMNLKMLCATQPFCLGLNVLIWLIHWGRVTHICLSKLTNIGSDNGLSPEWRQAIIWTNAGILLIGPLGTNFSEILIKIQTFSLKKMHLKMSSAKWRPFCLGLNVLIWLILPIQSDPHFLQVKQEASRNQISRRHWKQWNLDQLIWLPDFL